MIIEQGMLERSDCKPRTKRIIGWHCHIARAASLRRSMCELHIARYMCNGAFLYARLSLLYNRGDGELLQIAAARQCATLELKVQNSALPE